MAVTLIRQESRYSPTVEVIIQGGNETHTGRVYEHLAALAIGLKLDDPWQQNPFQEKFNALRQLAATGTYDRGTGLFRERTYDRACRTLAAVAMEQAAYEPDEQATFDIQADEQRLADFISYSDYGLMTHQGIAADENFEAEKFPLRPLDAYEALLVAQDKRITRRAMQYEVSSRVASNPQLRLEDAAHESLGSVSTQDNRFVPIVTILNESYLANRDFIIAQAQLEQV